MESRVKEDRQDWQKWTLDDILLLLRQSACYSISLVTEKMMNKPEGFSDLDAWNKFAGIQIKRAGVSHALLYTFANFKKAVQSDECDKNKSITRALCLLFGVHTVLYSSASIYEGGFVLPKHNTSLLRLKQRLLQQIRPELIGILDSFLVSEGYIRSAFASGNPYDVKISLCRISYKWQENAK